MSINVIKKAKKLDMWIRLENVRDVSHRLGEPFCRNVSDPWSSFIVNKWFVTICRVRLWTRSWAPVWWVMSWFLSCFFFRVHVDVRCFGMNETREKLFSSNEGEGGWVSCETNLNMRQYSYATYEVWVLETKTLLIYLPSCVMPFCKLSTDISRRIPYLLPSQKECLPNCG